MSGDRAMSGDRGGLEPILAVSGAVATTRAGDGFERRAFTAAEVFKMQEIGVIDDAEGFELIEGDLVMMQAKNAPHERVKLALVRGLSRALPDTLQLGVETSLILGERVILEPDLSIFPMMDSTDARGPDILLAIEIAEATLREDLGPKAALYARYGVCELWGIDVKKRTTTVH